MGIDFSKFSKEVQAKIKAAIEDINSPNKIDAAEIRAMNLEKEVAIELMKELSGNQEFIGDGFYQTKSNNNNLLLLDKLENDTIIPLSKQSLEYYFKLYPDKDIKNGYYHDGKMYLLDSSGTLVKDKFNNYISENINIKEYENTNIYPQFLEPDGRINADKLQLYLNSLPETDEDYQTLMKDIDNATKEHSYWSIEQFGETQKERFLEVYNAINNGEFTQAAELMYSYFQIECQGFDENVLSKIRSGLERITGAKWAGPALYNVLSLVAENADNLIGRDENNIGYAERFVVGLDNIGQGLGDFVFSSEGLFTMGAIAAGEALLAKASSTLAPYVGAAIHSYFGAEGVNLVVDGSVKVATGDTLEEIAEGGQEIGYGLPLMGTVVRAGGAVYKGLKSKTKQILSNDDSEAISSFFKAYDKTSLTKQEIADLKSKGKYYKNMISDVYVFMRCSKFKQFLRKANFSRLLRNPLFVKLVDNVYTKCSNDAQQNNAMFTFEPKNVIANMQAIYGHTKSSDISIKLAMWDYLERYTKFDLYDIKNINIAPYQALRLIEKAKYDDFYKIYKSIDYKKEDKIKICLSYMVLKELSDNKITIDDINRWAKDENLIKWLPELALSVKNASNIQKFKRVCDTYKEMEISPRTIQFLFADHNPIKLKELQKISHTMGNRNISRLDNKELRLAFDMLYVYKITSINEITAAGKKNFIRKLVDCNNGMFQISDAMKEMFPLIPTDVEQYCGVMRATVKSLGIETNPLTPEQRITMFNHSMKDLSKSLADLSDEEFAGLHITQEFSREDFIAVVREKTKDLSQLEKQKVYDYFGFELHHKKAKEQRKEYTITGYPVNLNNGKKLAEISDPKTKAVVESLRPDVIRFSEQNPIRCENSQVETFLNEVVSAMPEVRSMIGRAQHGNNGTKGAHDFDVMQHSLKVMQKITQDSKFNELNESDQRLMLLASLLHDITKAEGISDHTHASEGGFDTYYICKKLKLTEEEELKLFNLTRFHEWLNFVNKSKSEEQLSKRLQSVAFDMQNENLFDMALIFTHADLKAVKADDTFHDTRVGDTRAVFDKDDNRFFGTLTPNPSPLKGEGNDVTSLGVKKSHGETADIYAKRIKEYIHELQTTRPLTPTTKVPAMSDIKSRLKVNPNGSTQFKGVWVDNDGLVVIKVNDVEDWEGIGFPKGTSTKGIKANVKNHGEERHEVETGNFKLFVHGLDYPNQLVKFERFTLPDTKALLSITYVERPETKSRFFRTQGVGLDFDQEHIHGGGETDAGSGYGKNINDFKEEYIFGGEREGDRRFTADIVKRETGMSDEEYIEFYNKHKNQSWSEYDDQELASGLVRAYAENIKSTVRDANRAYTEYYGDKIQRVNSTFAYSVDPYETIENPLEFLNRAVLTYGEENVGKVGFEEVKPVKERTGFLRNFSLKKDVPMLIFGD